MDEVAKTSGEPAGVASTGDNQNGNGPSRFDQRIAQLVREREQMRGQFTQAAQELQNVREELTSLREGLSSRSEQSDAGTPQSWADLSDSDLRRIITNQGQENPEYMAAALEEMVRRRVETQVTRAKKDVNTEHSVLQEKNRVMTEAARRFGSDVNDSSSELFRLADQYYAREIEAARLKFGEKQGKEVVDRTPSLMLNAFAQAYHDLHSGERDELQNLRAEMERRKRMEAMERGTGGVWRPNNERADALRKGDVKSAIRQSSTFRSFLGE